MTHEPEPGLPLVTIVVPMYNEAAIAARSLSAVIDYLHTLEDRFRFEVLVIDDGSTDDTREVASAFAADNPGVRVLAHRTNFRLGQALRYAFRQSRGDYVVTYDADLTYSPDHIGRLLDAITETGARIVVASPYMPGGRTYGIPLRRRILSRGANRFLALTAQGHLHTLTGLVRAYDGPFIRTLDLKAVDSDVNTEIIYKAEILRARVEEIPATLDWRDIGARRPVKGFNTRLYWTTAKQLVSGFLFRPFMFFLLPGLALLASATVFGGVVVSAILDQRGNPDHPSWLHATRDAFDAQPTPFLLGSVSLVLAVQMLTLAVVTLQAKRYFEELFHLATTVRREMSEEPMFRGDRS